MIKLFASSFRRCRQCTVSALWARNFTCLRSEARQQTKAREQDYAHSAAQRDVDGRIFWGPRISDAISWHEASGSRRSITRQGARSLDLRSVSPRAEIIAIPLNAVTYPGYVCKVPSPLVGARHVPATIAEQATHPIDSPRPARSRRLFHNAASSHRLRPDRPGAHDDYQAEN